MIRLYLHRTGRYALVFLVLIALYMVFAFAASILPDKKVNAGISQTLRKGDLQQDYPCLFVQVKQCQTDNFTDALILSQAWNFQYHGVWYDMMMPTYTKCGVSMCDNLHLIVEGQSCGDDRPYPRYWHGSTFLMRYLLLITDYFLWRILFFVIGSLLVIWAFLRLRKAAGLVPAVLFLLSYLMLYGYIMQCSIQFFPVLVLSLAGVISACDTNRKSGNFAFVLFVLGSLTAFFDLLTTPLLTFGLPVCAWLVVRREMIGRQSWGKGVKQFASKGFAWISAYALTWSVKWFIATVGTDVNVFQDALEQTGHRFNDMEQYGRWDAVIFNFDMLPLTWIIVTAVAVLLLAVWRFNRKGLKPMLFFVLIGLLPYIWYLMVANHSYLHWWFTYRLQMVSVLALFYALFSLVDCSSEWYAWRRFAKS